MIDTPLYKAGLEQISEALGHAITASARHTGEEALAALVGHVDKIRGYIDSMAAKLSEEPDPAPLRCAACIQDARNAAAAGTPPLPIHFATTIANGIAICDVEGRHRLVTPAQAVAAQSGRLLLPGQAGPLPPLNGHAHG